MTPRKSDWQNIDYFLDAFAKVSKNFIDDLDERNVAQLGVALEARLLSPAGEGFQSALEILCDQIVPQLSASRGPRYWGFVTGGATPVATFADWLVSSFDQNLSKDGDSIASDVERQTIRWLTELFELPEEFDGIITTGATSANFLGALCARQFAGLKQGIDVAKEGAYALDIEIFSTAPHASMIKSLGMAGLGQRHVSYINALPNSEEMDTADLARHLSQSKVKAKVIIASVGTVTATDFDDLETIISLAKQYDAWLHVDGAFGIFERLLGSNHLSKGLELADSITLDSHKWLNVPYESGVFLTRHLKLLFGACDVPAPYLVSNPLRPDFMSLGIENSRRFRALPVWMTLLAYGKKGIAKWVQSNIDCARLLADKIQASSYYELVLDCKLNVVLFRPDSQGLSAKDADEKAEDFLEKINAQGKVFLSPGVWQGKKIIRAALSNWETQPLDVEIAFESMLNVAQDYHENLHS